jgi:hypothetical protein
MMNAQVPMHQPEAVDILQIAEQEGDRGHDEQRFVVQRERTHQLAIEIRHRVELPQWI